MAREYDILCVECTRTRLTPRVMEHSFREKTAIHRVHFHFSIRRDDDVTCDIAYGGRTDLTETPMKRPNVLRSIEIKDEHCALDVPTDYGRERARDSHARNWCLVPS